MKYEFYLEICLYGAFLENSLAKQNIPFPHMLAVCMQGEGESLSFFSKASWTVHGFAWFIILLLRWFGGTEKVRIAAKVLPYLGSMAEFGFFLPYTICMMLNRRIKRNFPKNTGNF